jgi:hypothetical protein
MQLTYNDNPPIGRAGMIADTRILRHINSRIATGAIMAGYGVFRVPSYGGAGPRNEDPGQVYQETSPAPAADADAIKTSFASVVAGQSIAAGDANGAVGSGDMFPPRQLTLVLSTEADWLAGDAVITYVGDDGLQHSETLAIVAGGNETLTTTGYARSFVSLTLPAADGTVGTATIGIAALGTTLTLADFEGIAMYDASHMIERDQETEYVDKDSVPVIRKGAVYVITEDACTPSDDVYVRISGTGQLGAFRSDADSASAVKITNGRFSRTSTANGLNILELE